MWYISIPSTVRDGEWEDWKFFDTEEEALREASNIFGADETGCIRIVFGPAEEDDPDEAFDYCTFCGRAVDPAEVHKHQDGWVCDDCWDPRLDITA